MAEQVAPIEITGPEDLPEVSPRVFRYWQNGKQYMMRYFPLTAEEIEHIRASLPEPEAPTKPLEGKDAKELKILAHQGHPTSYKDYNDPTYQEALQKREESIVLEMMRVALRWGPLPRGQKPDEALIQARDEFAQAIRTRLTAGNHRGLQRAITEASFALDQGLIESFLTDSPPPTATDVVS